MSDNHFTGIQAHPLHWPMGKPRTKTPKKSAFKTGFAKARDGLFAELKRMGIGNWNVILSTNVNLRRDGLPRAGESNPSDAGVAVYFRYKDKPMAFSCDTYILVEDNIHAIAKTIEYLRAIERYGSSEMMESAFMGFQALPPPKSKKPWWEVLGTMRVATHDVIRKRYLELSREHHPDRGGDPQRMAEINQAYAEATV